MDNILPWETPEAVEEYEELRVKAAKLNAAFIETNSPLAADVTDASSLDFLTLKWLVKDKRLVYSNVLVVEKSQAIRSTYTQGMVPCWALIISHVGRPL